MQQPTPPPPDGHRPAPPDRRLSITVGQDDGRLIVQPAGDIDMESQLQLAEFLATAIDEGTAVVIDLCEVGFIDSSGLAALVYASNRARDQDVTLCLRNPPDTTRRVLHLSGVDQVLPIEDGAMSDGSRGHA